MPTKRKKYIYIEGNLCRRTNKDGEPTGNILIAHTVKGSRVTKYASTGTEELSKAREQAAKMMNRSELLTKRGSELTYDAGWAMLKEMLENQNTKFWQKEYRWQQMQPALGHLHPTRCKAREHDKPGSFFAKHFEDVRLGRNGARVLSSGRKPGPLDPASLKLYKADINQIHHMWVARGIIASDQLPAIEVKAVGKYALDHLPLPEYFAQADLDKLIREGHRSTNDPQQTERLKGRPYRGLLLLLIGICGPRRERMEKGCWSIVNWDLRKMNYPAALHPSNDGVTPDRQHLTTKPAPVVTINNQLYPVLRAAYEYDLARCDGDVEKVKRMPILGTSGSADRLFGKMCQRALGRHGNVHMLKHTGITLALGSGKFDIYRVATMFATSPETIIKYYWHAIPKDDQDVIDAIMGKGRRAAGNVVQMPVRKRDRK